MSIFLTIVSSSKNVGIGNINIPDITQKLTVDGNLKLSNPSGAYIKSSDDIYISSSADINLLSDTYITNSKVFGSNAFLSGTFGGGYRISRNSDNQSQLQIDNILVRGTLQAGVFQKDVVRASNGYLFISDCSQIAIDSFASQKLIYVKQNNFQLGDILWYKGINDSGVDSIKVIISNIQQHNYTIQEQLFSCYKISFTQNRSGNFTIGNSIVRIGNIYSTNRNGSIYFDASSNTAPFMDVYDGVSSIQSFGSHNKLKARLGNLNGIVDNQFGLLQGYGLYATDNVYIKGVINALSGGTIGGWNIGQSNIYNQNLQLNSEQGFIKINQNVRFNRDGSFLLKNNQNNYIKSQNNQLQIKTDNINIQSQKFLLSSNDQCIRFGSIASYNNGSGIFIGKDLSHSASNLESTLQSSTGNQLSIGGQTASAFSYSDYKMFIGQSNGNYLRYDGKNIQITGKIIANSGKIANWDITQNSLQTGNFNTINGMYFGVSGLSLGNAFVVSSTGNLTASNALLSGSISSSVGTIGGWTLNGSAIYRASATYGNVNGMYFGTQGLSIKNTFLVSSTGNLTASNANISGSISSSNGTIGGWSIGSNFLRSTNITMSNASGGSLKIGSVTSTNASTTNRGVFVSGSGDILIKGSGSSTNYLLLNNSGMQIKTSNFQLSNGNITASSGQIGGWNISSDSIYSGSNNFDSSISMYFGQSGLSIKDKFRVTNQGFLYANNATISGSINSSMGLIGCWNINSSSIYSSSNQFNNHQGIYFGEQGISLSDKFSVDKFGNLIAQNAQLTGKIYSEQGNIANWSIDPYGIHSNNIHLDSFNQTIRINQSIILNGDGSFEFKSSQDNYIRSINDQLQIKSKTLYIESQGFYLDSISQNLRFGNVTQYNSGSGIFIGKDYTSKPEDLSGVFGSTANNQLSIGSQTASAYSYSDYKLFIGSSTGNYLRYDGKDVELSGKIKANSGQIGGWNIDDTKLYKDFVSMTVNSNYWNVTSSFPTGSSVVTVFSGDITNTASIPMNTKHFITHTTSVLVSNTQNVLHLKIDRINGSETRLCDILIYEYSGSTQKLIYQSLKSINYTYNSFDYYLSYKPTLSNSRFRILYVLNNLSTSTIASGSWEAFTDVELYVSRYNNLTQISNKGLFIFNSPSDYIRMGTINNGSVSSSICQFKTSKFESNQINTDILKTSRITSPTNGLNLLNGLSVGNNSTQVNSMLQIVKPTPSTVPFQVYQRSQIAFGVVNNVTSSTVISHRGPDGTWRHPLRLSTYSGSSTIRGGFGTSENLSYNWYFNGSLGATGDIVSNVSSDERLKQDVKLIDNPLQKLEKISGYNFKFNQLAQDHLKGTFKNGVIAQQLKQILPQAVVQRQDGYLAVDYNQIIPLLIQCIKQQGKQIKQLRMTKNVNINI